MTFEAIVLLAVVFGCYLLTCVVWPYSRCPRCQGGKSRSPNGRWWRECSRCGGKGRRVRLGARLIRRF